MGIEPFDYSATQMLNGSCILGVVVGDSLRAWHWSLPLWWPQPHHGTGLGCSAGPRGRARGAMAEGPNEGGVQA